MADLLIKIKTSKETFTRKLTRHQNKWWEEWLYNRFKNHSKVHLGTYKLRGGISKGERETYYILWRLIMWRHEPVDINPDHNGVIITLDEVFENLLYKDINQVKLGWVPLN